MKTVLATSRTTLCSLLLSVACTGSVNKEAVTAKQDKPAPGLSVSVSKSDTKPTADEPTVNVRSWDFDSDLVGKTPVGWTTGEINGESHPNAWHVHKDSFAQSGENLLAVSKSQNGKLVFSVALVDGVKQADVDVELHVKADGGSLHQGGGIAFRATDLNSYYVCRWNPLEGNIRIYVVNEQLRRKLIGANTTVDMESWHELRVVAKGPTIECYLDGELLLELEDLTLTEAGTIGIWTKADAVSRFDDLVLVTPR